MAGQGNRESARIGETIEQAAARVLAGGVAVLPLVEVAAGFLPTFQVVAEFHSILFHHHLADVLARQHACLLRQSFKPADGDVVALQDAERREMFPQDFDDGRLQPLHSLAEGLQDEAFGVTVDDEGREQVALRRHQTVGPRSFHNLLAKRGSRANPLGEEGAVERSAFPREQAHGDLRLAAVQRLPPEALLTVQHADDSAGLDARGVSDIGAIDPKMAGSYPLDAAGFDGQGRHMHAVNLPQGGGQNTRRA